MDLSALSDQERALLAQFLAVKSGGVENAMPLLQMVMDQLASGQHGKTLYDVIAEMLPNGIPVGTDFSPYLQFLLRQGAGAAGTDIFGGGTGEGSLGAFGEQPRGAPLVNQIAQQILGYGNGVKNAITPALAPAAPTQAAPDTRAPSGGLPHATVSNSGMLPGKSATYRVDENRAAEIIKPIAAQQNPLAWLATPEQIVGDPAFAAELGKYGITYDHATKTLTVPDTSVLKQLPPGLDSALSPLTPGSAPVGPFATMVVEPAKTQTLQSTDLGKAPQPAGVDGLAAARAAVAQAVNQGKIDLDPASTEYLVRAVATEVDPYVLTHYGADAYAEQAHHVVDVILNRLGSGQFGATLPDVLNAPNQFSAINGPKRPGREHYGSVENIPASRADQTVRQLLADYIDARRNGAPSSVGGAVNYGNPALSDRKNQGWVLNLNGPHEDFGIHSHFYGTAPGHQPFEANFGNPASADPVQQSWFNFNPSHQDSLGSSVVSNAIRSGAQIQSQLLSGNGDGGARLSSSSGPFTEPTQRISTSGTGGGLTVEQRNAFGGYTTGTTSTPAARTTDSNQRISSSGGGSLTVSQRNAFGGYGF